MEQLEYQEGRTELDALGEFALIERLTDEFDPIDPTTLKGVGDDCAVVGKVDDNSRLLASTQTLAEGVDFDMMYTPLKHLGYKAVAVALSNIAAMNGTPRQVLVSIAVSNRYSVEALEELYAGIRLCCSRYDVDLVGGDTRSSRSGMVITVTALGTVDADKITFRSGAQMHDLVCVSGDLGSAYAGLLILEGGYPFVQAAKLLLVGAASRNQQGGSRQCEYPFHIKNVRSLYHRITIRNHYSSPGRIGSGFRRRSGSHLCRNRSGLSGFPGHP